jgi:Caspase domain
LGEQTVTDPTTQPTDASFRELDAPNLSQLRPYVVNLNQGKFSDEGSYSTAPTDVDDIFAVHLPKFLESRGNRRVPIVVWAHGGLIDETKGLAIARGQIAWWLSNGIYPLHFVWESGMLDALRTVVGDYFATRDVADYTSDPVIEHLVRPIGSRVWLAMKQSARMASGADGGAKYVADRLAAFIQSRPDSVSIHAVGHSAGSIFHSHFIPAALTAGVPSFTTASFLAPAINVADFSSTLHGLIGPDDGIDRLSLFTMRRELERDDSCLRVYRKSLLYLVSRALEDRRDTPLLGLEDSLRGSPEMRELFRISERTRERDLQPPRAEVIWSLTTDGPAGSRSASTTHGGFDNDKTTMESVAFRILSANDGAAPAEIKPFPPGLVEPARSLWVDAGAVPTMSTADYRPPAPASVVGVHGDSSRKFALCIGINGYPRHPLSGARADAEQWANQLAGLGYSVETLFDGQATRAAMHAALVKLVSDKVPGDVVVFQYAGHGTSVPDDVFANVPGFDNEFDSRDEALCPVDFEGGGLLLDDEIARIIAQHLDPRVNLTGFLDCCHSGSAFRGGDPRAGEKPGLVARYIRFYPEMISAENLAPRTPRSALPQVTSHVMFSACRDNEKAYESDGQGHFTMHASKALRIPNLTNKQFEAEVTKLFDRDSRQHPGLQSFEPQAENRQFLAPIV